MQELINRMKKIMQENGTNAKQVTEILDISGSSFTDWSRGKGTPSIATLSKFCKQFNISLDYLVFGIEKINVQNIQKEISNEDMDFLIKLHKLPKEQQIRVIGFIEGLLAVIPEDKRGEKLSV